MNSISTKVYISPFELLISNSSTLDSSHNVSSSPNYNRPLRHYYQEGSFYVLHSAWHSKSVVKSFSNLFRVFPNINDLQYNYNNTDYSDLLANFPFLETQEAREWALNLPTLNMILLDGNYYQGVEDELSDMLSGLSISLQTSSNDKSLIYLRKYIVQFVLQLLNDNRLSEEPISRFKNWLISTEHPEDILKLFVKFQEYAIQSKVAELVQLQDFELSVQNVINKLGINFYNDSEVNNILSKYN